MKKRIKNNGIFYVVISLALVLAVGSIAYAFTGNAQRVIENVEVYNEATQPATSVDEGMLGAFPGGDIYNRVNMHSGYQYGGDVHATSSTASTFTLTRKELGGDIYYINWTPNKNTTLTTMATTSSGFYFMNIPEAGDTRSYILVNASSTAASTITIAAGTGVDLQDNEDASALEIAGLDVGKLTFIRKPNTDVMLIFEQWTEAD